ncbi:hypothetical protein U1Q18_052752 [Sarracenia purpurea var. burkii]
MRIGRDRLTPFNTPLVGFTGEKVYPLGTIQLPVTLGDGQIKATQMLTFLVVDSPSAYNIILGRTALNQFQAVSSTYHLVFKFPAEGGVGYSKGNQLSARECYMTSIKEGGRASTGR